MRCKYCKGWCIKNGLQSNGVQRFKCKICNRRQQETYRYNYYKWDRADALICSMLVNGSGIRNISRVLNISTTTVLAKIKFVASTINPKYANAYFAFGLTKIKDFVKVNPDKKLLF